MNRFGIAGAVSALLALVLITTGCTKSSSDGAVLARVNRGAITATDFRKQVEDLAPQMRQAVTTDPKARKEFLDDLIGIELVVQEAKRQGLDKDAADTLVSELMAAGAKAEVHYVPVGPDLARGWGKRRTVAADYLFDDPVMLGSVRIGPDLANVGMRLPDANWHLRHLYEPRLEVKDSPMPPYRFLFEKKKIERRPSPDALQLPADLAPAPGWEIVPRPEAQALVAYLQSLRANAVLFETPMTAPATTGAPTNAPAK